MDVFLRTRCAFITFSVQRFSVFVFCLSVVLLACATSTRVLVVSKVVSCRIMKSPIAIMILLTSNAIPASFSTWITVVQTNFLETLKGLDATTYVRHPLGFRFVPKRLIRELSLQRSLQLCGSPLDLDSFSISFMRMSATGWFVEVLLEDIYSCFVFLPNDLETLDCCSSLSSFPCFKKGNFSVSESSLSLWI